MFSKFSRVSGSLKGRITFYMNQEGLLQEESLGNITQISGAGRPSIFFFIELGAINKVGSKNFSMHDILQKGDDLSYFELEG